MLMFDNAIFATFIPQFLMVLGFFSAIISAGISHMNQEEKLSRQTINIETVAKTNLEQHEVSSTYHFTNHQIQYEESIESESVSIQLSPHNVKELIIDISQYFSLSKKVAYTLFMRPPPSFSLF